MNLRNVIWALVAVSAVAVFLNVMSSGRSAPIPPVFANGTTYEQAAQHAAASGKPVLVFATADWCGPCQAFKRGALRDPAVEAWIREHTEPVYLNVDQRKDIAGSLGVISIPATFVLRDGQVTAKLSGGAAAADYLAWLQSAAP